MAALRVSITVRVRWWVQPYLTAIYWFALVTRMQPDEGKVSAMVRRGMVVETRLVHGPTCRDRDVRGGYQPLNRNPPPRYPRPPTPPGPPRPRSPPSRD